MYVILQALKIEEFEYFPALLQKIIPRISHCCSPELLQLMQLPAVKIVRINIRNVRYEREKDDVLIFTGKSCSVV